MKILKYNLCTNVNLGTEDEPQIEEILSPVTMGWNEADEEIAKREAHEGKYTVEDDGQPEINEPSIEERVSALERASVPDEYVAGEWYYRCDRITYNGVIYVCVAPDGAVCTWNPVEYPAYWRKEE